MVTVAIDRSMHGSLREEVQLLRRRVVTLETAEADNEKIRKEISKLHNSKLEEKAQLELVFMNQLTGVARENALKLEELEGRLTEGSKVNRALSEQLQDSETPEQVKRRIEAFESLHRKELAEIIDRNMAEVEQLQKQLYTVQTSRDELTEKLDDTRANLELKQSQVDSLDLKVKALSNSTASNALKGSDQNASASGSLQKLLKDAHAENAKLKSTVRSLEKDFSGKSDLFKIENQILQERLASCDSEMNAKLSEVQRLESELAKEKRKPSKNSVEESHMTLTLKNFEKENFNLENRLQKSETGRKQLEMQVMQLEHNNHQSKITCQRLERENKDVKATLQRVQQESEELKKTADKTARASSSVAVRAAGSNNGRSMSTEKKESTPRPEVDSAQPKSYEKRTTQIIRQLEHNLKREGQMKQNMTAGLKFRKQRTEAEPNPGLLSDSDNSKSIECLQADVYELKQKLGKERDLTANLRHEIQETKGTQQRSYLQHSLGTSKIPNINAAPSHQNERDFVSLAERKASLNLSLAPISKMKQQADDPVIPSQPRTPVKGLVQSFERRMLQTDEPLAIKRAIDFHSEFDADDVDGLKEGLNFEREQVLELEEELTRQCEINCSLLKEISSLTSETESSRAQQSQQFENSCMADQKEIDKLSAELSKLKTQFSQTEESKLTLSKKFELVSSNDRREIENLTSELSKLRSQISEVEGSKSSISKHFELASSSDWKEIDRLKLKVREIQTKLEEAEEEMKKLQDESMSDHREIQRGQKLIDDSEITHSREIEKLESRAEELETELSKAKDSTSDYDSSRQDEIAGLNSLVEALQFNLADADETKAGLEKEKETAGRLDALVQHLKEQLAESERKCETLSKDNSEQSLLEKEEKESLESQVDSLVAELGRVTEKSRDELESKDRENQEKFESVQSKVDRKVEEFELTHSVDKEAIGRLQEQVNSLQQELQDTLVTVEDLEKRLKEKEDFEVTIEALARKNQQSVDCQINKLSTELTKNHVAEGDYKKKIQSYEDMIDSMQMEMEENLEEKEREIEELKRSVVDNKNMIDRLKREKDQLVLSMNDMTTSRRDEIDELQTELMKMSTRAANQAREVQAVKVQLEESSYRKDEVERLRARVRELGDQLTSRDGARMHERTALEVENSELRQKSRQRSMEQQAAENKLREMREDKGSSKSVQVLRERNAVLKFEVEKLTKKLKKFTERKTNTNANTVAERFMI